MKSSLCYSLHTFKNKKPFHPSKDERVIFRGTTFISCPSLYSYLKPCNAGETVSFLLTAHWAGSISQRMMEPSSRRTPISFIIFSSTFPDHRSFNSSLYMIMLTDGMIVKGVA